jgi:hypothetical protein
LGTFVKSFSGNNNTLLFKISFWGGIKSTLSFCERW